MNSRFKTHILRTITALSLLIFSIPFIILFLNKNIKNDNGCYYIENIINEATLDILDTKSHKYEIKSNLVLFTEIKYLNIAEKINKIGEKFDKKPLIILIENKPIENKVVNKSISLILSSKAIDLLEFPSLPISILLNDKCEIVLVNEGIDNIDIMVTAWIMQEKNK